MIFCINDAQSEDCQRAYNAALAVKTLEIEARAKETGKVQKYTARAYIEEPAPTFHVMLNSANQWAIFYVQSDGTLSPCSTSFDEIRREFEQDVRENRYPHRHENQLYALDPAFAAQIEAFVADGCSAGSADSSQPCTFIVKFRSVTPCMGYYSLMAGAPTYVFPAAITLRDGRELDVYNEEGLDIACL